jgi:hypothetical protein
MSNWKYRCQMKISKKYLIISCLFPSFLSPALTITTMSMFLLMIVKLIVLLTLIKPLENRPNK